jgi:hypothetical protein
VINIVMAPVSTGIVSRSKNTERSPFGGGAPYEEDGMMRRIA